MLKLLSSKKKNFSAQHAKNCGFVTEMRIFLLLLTTHLDATSLGVMTKADLHLKYRRLQTLAATAAQETNNKQRHTRSKQWPPNQHFVSIDLCSLDTDGSGVMFDLLSGFRCFLEQCVYLLPAVVEVVTVVIGSCYCAYKNSASVKSNFLSAL